MSNSRPSNRAWPEGNKAIPPDHSRGVGRSGGTRRGAVGGNRPHAPGVIVPHRYRRKYQSPSISLELHVRDAAGRPMTPAEVVAIALDADRLAPVFVYRSDESSVAKLSAQLRREGDRVGILLHIRIFNADCLTVFATAKPGPDQVRRAMDQPGGI